MTEQDPNQLPDATLTLAITDALAYAHGAGATAMRNIEIDDMASAIFEKAGRSGKVPREPAKSLNAFIAAVFIRTLADFGYKIVFDSEATTR